MCDTTFAFGIVAALFLILFFNVLIKIIRLVFFEKKPGKESLKKFLAIGLIFSAARSVYFVAFPFLHDECDDASQDSGDDVLWSVFGTLPSALFLSAFSVNITTLAKVYYTVTTLNHVGLIINNIGLVILNFVAYSLLIVWYALPGGETSDSVMRVYLWLLSATEFLIAALLLIFATLLYRRMTIRPNPMTRLFGSSIVCFICFCVKSVLIIILALLFDGTYPPVALVFYFIVSEIIPIVVMLIIFETSGKRGTEKGPGASGKLMSQKFVSKEPEDDPTSPEDPSIGYRELQDSDHPDPSINGS